MNTKHTTPDREDSLRRHGDTRMMKERTEAPPTENGAQELLKELQLCKIELEVQNGELRRTKFETEAALRQYAELYDLAPIAYFTLKHNGIINKVNAAAARLVKSTPEKLAGQEFRAFVPARSAHDFAGLVQDITRKRCKTSRELELEDSSGVTIFALIEAMPSQSGNEILLMVMDITGRKLAENALSRESHRNRMLMQLASDGIHVMDVNGDLLQANGAFYRMLGYSAEEMRSMNVSQWDAQLSPEELKTGFRQTVQQGTTRIINTRHRCRDGRIIDVEISAVAVEIDGEPLVYASSRDITKRKEVDAALAESEERLRIIMDAIDEAFWMVSTPRGKMLYVSSGFERIWGRPASSQYENQDTFLEAIHPDDRGRVLAILKAQENLQPFSHEYRIIRPDGAVRWIWDRGFPVRDTDGKVSRYAGVAQDITDRKFSDERLAESYLELQRLSSHLENLREDEREKIARDLHDEMGSLLATLKMRVAWLASNLPAGLPLLQDEASHISALVSDSINAVRSITTELRPNLQEGFGFAATIEDYVKKFQLQTDIECKLGLFEDELEVDANQAATLFRILQESLNNVAKHARASRVKILFARQDGIMSMQIEDNGIGFNLAEQTKQSFGLIGIRERALMIGGEARIGSSPGEGTRVTVTFPARDKSGAA